MLYLIGLGLGDCKDITIKGLEAIQRSEKVYLEAYTSILTVGQDELEKFYGKPLIQADRTFVEQECDTMLSEALTATVSFLVVGDPLGATTHSDLMIRAAQMGVKTQVIHNASIMNAVGCCGLQLYSFGETVSIVLWQENWRPTSYYDKIASNRKVGLHTLCLLDIKMKEQSWENLARGRKVFEPPRFMMVHEAAKQLIEILEIKEEEATSRESLAYSPESLAVGLARIGTENQKIVAGSLKQLTETKEILGGPLHSLILPSTSLHPLEWDMLSMFALDQEWFQENKKYYVK
ncbi:diphthine methyl ester synthase [Galendromus occidentalis]|uniref:diphthine methyl ester synthase n=1 Tax=Galendromus occidentalis TaxID=34638 RepID=A0AAJ6VX99_9ACAR|nr:diphthine methyl ester synthase [Galendromus occidentalis]